MMNVSFQRGGIGMATGIGPWVNVGAHKLFAPTPHADAIQREGILRQIAEHPSARVVMLQGPAGHGKSTALQQIKDHCEREGCLTAWLTLDKADNDPQRLIVHVQALIASLQESYGRPGAESTAVPDPRQRYRSDWILNRLFGIDRPVALFLDDFQVLSSKAALSFFKEMFERAPEGLRIFIGSRSLPDVGLVRLVVNRQAMILRSDDLCFTRQEVERFFAACGEFSVDEIESIYRRTEGWPAALQLFRLTLGSPRVRQTLGQSVARAPRELAEYLAENVLAMQPQRVQEFLLRTSLLTRLCAPLCDFIMGWHESQALLLKLERSGLFLRSIDSEPRWFEYHSLFSSIVADQLRTQSAETAKTIHRQAAQWYLAHGLFENAAHHAIECEEWALAADALNAWSSQLVADAHLVTLEWWSERLPFEEIAARPDLAIKVAYALSFLRRRGKVKPVLELLRPLMGTGSVLTTTHPDIVIAMAAIADDHIVQAFSIIDSVTVHHRDSEGFAAFELGAAANLLGYRALTMGDFEGAREYLTLARAYNDRTDAAFSSGYTAAVGGVSLLLQGALRDSLDRFKEGLSEKHVSIDKCFASAALASCYIWALYEASELESAESLFYQHSDSISESALPDFLTVAYVSMARIHDARGRAFHAEELLDKAEAIGHSNGWTRLLRTIRSERIRRALIAGETEKAVAISAVLGATPNEPLPAHWIPFASDAECEEFGEIRMAIQQMDLDRASELLDAEFKRQRGRVLRQIKLHLLRALCFARSRDRALAQRSLRQALRLGQPNRFIRCFLDEGNEVLQLLRAEYQSLLQDDRNGAGLRQEERQYIEALLQASGTDLGRRALVAADPQSLTEREREMLMLLVNGASNKDIAQRLFVSENTVKYHLKNIYSKLGVASRGRAVATAIQVGIVHEMQA